MVEPEERIDVERLEDGSAAAPPPGFADRVVEQWLSERAAVGREPTRSRRRAIVWTALLVAALLVAAFALRGEDGMPSSGSLRAHDRQSLALGERATMVAERGAEVGWRVETDGRTAVDQRAGRVFYRVDEGAPFEVATPRGTVRVTGTCFSVEVELMSRRNVVVAGTAAAALSAVVVVAVYEGGVVVAHDGVEVTAGAGERVVSDGERGLRRVGSEADEPDGETDSAITALARLDPAELARRVHNQGRELADLRARASAAQAEIDRLRAHVESLGGKPDDGASPRDRARRCANSPRVPGCSFVDPDDDTLQEMARCGTVRVDVPQLLLEVDKPARLSDDFVANAGLSPTEADALEEASEQFRQKHIDALVRLFVEAGGSPELAEDQPPRALEGMIGALLETADIEAARRRLAQELAGQISPPADPRVLPLADRFVRAIVGVGDGYEELVAKIVGPERAHELRLIDNGWAGDSSTYGGACEGD